MLIASPWNPYRPLRTDPPGPPIHAEAPPILEENAPEPEDDRPLKWSTRLLFAAPATLDILGTTSMNAALLWVPVSAYQMLSSSFPLRDPPHAAHRVVQRAPSRSGWLFGRSSFWDTAYPKHSCSRSQKLRLELPLWAGPTFKAAADLRRRSQDSILLQASSSSSWLKSCLPGSIIARRHRTDFTSFSIASQFVIEEKIMERHVVEPLVAVGWEGVSGFIIIGIAMPILHLLIGRTDAGRGGFFDAPNAIHELFSGPRIWGPAIIFAVSVAFTNFFGLQVTKKCVDPTSSCGRAGVDNLAATASRQRPGA